jgi:sulfide:quinone oxidoreductase
VPFDLLVGVPVHAAPRVALEAGLTDETGWVPVDLQTLETPYPGIFAIGDITSIRQPNTTGFFLPKAGIFADEQARVVARNISDEIIGEVKQSRFDGKGFCYLEVGDGMAAYGSGNFYAYPVPRVSLEPPTQQLHKERIELEREQLETLV